MAQTVWVLASARGKQWLETITSVRSRQREQIKRVQVVLASVGSSAAQQFMVPEGATRLFLGMMECYGKCNITDAFYVTVAPAPAGHEIPGNAMRSD